MLGRLRAIFGRGGVVDNARPAPLQQEEISQPPPLPYSDLNDVSWPGSDAPLHDHVQYLINSRDYIAAHPIPEGTNYFQYKHNPDGRDVRDGKTPAITDCCYDHFSVKYLSVGFPLFVKSDDNFFKSDGGGLRDDIKFSRPFFQDSLHRLLNHVIGEESLNDGTAKVGYQNGTHWYIEVGATSDRARLLGRAIIDEFVHSTKTNAGDLLQDIDARIKDIDRDRELARGTQGKTQPKIKPAGLG
jgi:hypothetical protein